MSQKIRIKLKSFDHNLVDKSAEKIVKTVKSTGAVVSGPVPLPTQKKIFTVNRSTFVNKKARAVPALHVQAHPGHLFVDGTTIDALMKLRFRRVSRWRSRSDFRPLPKIEAGLEPVGVAGAPNAGGCFPPERTQRAGLQPRGWAGRCRRHRKADAADGNN